MKIHQIFFNNSLRNFCYLISFEDGAIYCIDPFNATEVIAYLKQHHAMLGLRGIINTHDHFDHYSGNAELVSAYHCPVMAHKDANIPNKNKNLANNEIIYQTGEWTLKTVYTPGHTLTHICVILENAKGPYALFTGDCFFNAGVGNCHNGGDPEILFHTITDFFNQLPDEVLIYPGHEYLKRNLEFTMAHEPNNIEATKFLEKIKTLNLNEVFFINSMKTEREINTFLRLDSPNLKNSLKLENADSKKIFLKLRELRNHW